MRNHVLSVKQSINTASSGLRCGVVVIDLHLHSALRHEIRDLHRGCHFLEECRVTLPTETIVVGMQVSPSNDELKMGRLQRSRQRILRKTEVVPHLVGVECQWVRSSLWPTPEWLPG